MATGAATPRDEGTKPARPAEPRIAQTLDRGLEILQVLSHEPTGRTTAEIAVALDVHRSIAHRLLATLERRRLVARTETGAFELGLGLVGLAASVAADLRAVVRPYLTELGQSTGETVHLVVQEGWDVRFIDGVESSSALRVATRIGRRLPAHATSVGKALLARLDESDLARWLERAPFESLTAATIVDADALAKELSETAARGYAINREESEDLVGSVGVAVGGRHALALSIAAPIPRLDNDAVSRFAELLLSARSTIEAELDGTPGTDTSRS